VTTHLPGLLAGEAGALTPMLESSGLQRSWRKGASGNLGDSLEALSGTVT